MTRPLHPDARSTLSGYRSGTDSYVSGYRKRGYVRLIWVGQILAVVGLFFGFYWLGAILLLIGGALHFHDSRSRIRMLEHRLSTFRRAKS